MFESLKKCDDMENTKKQSIFIVTGCELLSPKDREQALLIITSEVPILVFNSTTNILLITQLLLS